jgi:hypothetical protein
MSEDLSLFKEFHLAKKTTGERLKKESESADYRCHCGSLMAKITPRGIEIKCRKCKRVQLIPNSQVQMA